MPAKVNVGVMAFNQTPTILQSPTTDRAAAREAIDALEVSGGTATGDAVLAALRALANAPGTRTGTPPAAIVLLSDGESTRGADPVEAARQAADAKVPIYTVALGTAEGTIVDRRPHRERPARPRHARARWRRRPAASPSPSPTPPSSTPSTSGWARSSAHATRQRQITAWFAGGGLLMLLAAGGMSLRWFGRLV